MADERITTFGAGRSQRLAAQLGRYGIQLEQRHGETVLVDPSAARANLHPVSQILFYGFVILLGVFFLLQAITGSSVGGISLLLKVMFFTFGPLAILGGLGGIWLTFLKLQALQRAEPGELAIAPYPLHPGDSVTVRFRRRFKRPSGSNPGRLSATVFGLEVQKDNSDPPPSYRATPIWVENLPEKQLASGLMQIDHTWHFRLPPDAAPTLEEPAGYRTRFMTWGVDVQVEIPGFVIDQSAFLFLVKPL
ncbi:hypothetical protein [Thermoleptolyngbya sp.]